MKEMNIFINESEVNYLHYIQKNIKCKQRKIICAIATMDNMSVLSIACEESEFSKLITKLKKLISDVIVFIYKERYLLENIDFKNVNEAFKLALLKALVLFDSECDKEYIKSKLNFNGDLVIDSFVNFKLKPLKNRWKEVCKLANENSNHFFESETLLDLLKFLITTIKPKANLVNVYFNGKIFEFKDEKNKKIKVDFMDKGVGDEVSLITSLIALAPNVVNIFCINNMSNNTFKVLYYIFDKKVNLHV